MDLDPFQVAGVDGRAGLDDPRAPLANSSVARATSSTAIRTCASRAVFARTSTTGPISQRSKSTLWMAWFMRAPPPSSSQCRASAAVVIGLAAIPLHIGVAEGQAAEAAALDRSFQFLAGVVEPRGEDRREHDARAAAGLDDAIATAEGDFQRFLHENVLAGPCRGDGGLHGAAGRADGDDVYGRVGQHGIES